MATTKRFPILYKKTNTGAIQQWEIHVVGTVIETTFGQVGGKLQNTSDKIRSGKNAGRKNETAPEEQALKEAKSQWTKKKKSGYVETMSQAQDGETDALIEGGILPMLAKVYEDHESKITFPVAVQPKLDGHRCLALIGGDGLVSLWTRTRKRITSVPHIEARVAHIAKKMKLRNVVLDGELYNHRFKDDFEKITSLTRKKEASVEAIAIQYHVYDIITDEGFQDRITRLNSLVLLGGNTVILVETKFAASKKYIDDCFQHYKELGYEGAMVRQLDIPYENKRSHQLLKVKLFEDAEFQVLRVEEGRGKLQGHAGAFVCRDINAGEFKAKMSGETEKLKEYFANKQKYIGRMLTVQFQGRTKDGIPRFPVGLRFWEPI